MKLHPILLAIMYPNLKRAKVLALRVLPTRWHKLEN